MNDYDGLNLCAECGDAYTTGTLCHNCARQRAIDNDPMTGYDAIHYDTMYGYDDDEYDDDEPLYRSYADDFAFPDTYYDDDDADDYLDMYEDDGYSPYEYDDDETIDLLPSWRWKWYKFKSKMRYLWVWKLSLPVHTLRMKYDKRYRDNYWTNVIPF